MTCGNPSAGEKSRLSKLPTKTSCIVTLNPTLIKIHSIVAVHGLGSEADKAWAHGQTEFNWLARLPEEDGIHARVMAYYHNTQWDSHSLCLSLEDLGQSLLDHVEFTRSSLSVSMCQKSRNS